MVGTAVTQFADRPERSAALSKYFEEKSNIATRESVPSLSIAGKSFGVSLSGEMTPLMQTDSDGDMVPATSFKVIILDQAPQRGRAYYIKGFDPANPAMPDCWSDDSAAPSRHAKGTPKDEKGVCFKTCAVCPMSAKGSKKTDAGKDTTACSQYQLIALVPAKDPNFEPLRLKLPITSVYDGQNPQNDAENWYAFSNYTTWLRANGIRHTAEVITKIKFDKGANYPKLLFFKDAWTPNDVVDKLIPVIESAKVKQLVSASWTPNGVDGQRTATSGTVEEGPDERAEAAKDITPKGPTPEELAAAAEALEKVEAAKAAQAKAARIAAAKLAAAKLLAEAEGDEGGEPEAAPAEPAKHQKGSGGATASLADDDGDPALPGSAEAKPTPAAVAARGGASQAKATAAAPLAAGKAATVPAAGAAPKDLSKLLGKWGDPD